jgi:hypothetical protein
MLAKTTAGTSIPDSAFAILDSVSQSNTVWSIVYALKDGKVHFRTKAVPKVKSVELATFSFACIALGLAREYPRVCEPSHQHGEQLCR